MCCMVHVMINILRLVQSQDLLMWDHTQQMTRRRIRRIDQADFDAIGFSRDQRQRTDRQALTGAQSDMNVAVALVCGDSD